MDTKHITNLGIFFRLLKRCVELLYKVVSCQLSVVRGARPRLSRTLNSQLSTLNSSGFTLIETFVAILVLVFAVVGPLTLTTRSLNATLSARDELVATYLAQEAIEHVRFVRDGSMLRGEDWMALLGECVGQYCALDVWDTNVEPQACGSSGCDELELNDATHEYGYNNGGDVTQFVRSIRIDNTAQVDEKTIVVTVEWESGTRAHSIEIRENILDWASGSILAQ